MPIKSERDDEWDSPPFWEDAWLWMSNAKWLSSRLYFTSQHCNGSVMKHLFFFCHNVTQALTEETGSTYGTYVRTVWMCTLVETDRSGTSCTELLYDQGWRLDLVSAQRFTNRLKKCRFGFCAIFSWYPAAESRSQKPRDDRTLCTQRLWSDILMLLSLNHWDVQRRTHRYSKGELSFTFKPDIWDGMYEML